MAQLRGASLTLFDEVASSVGLDPKKLRRSVGLPDAGVSDPDSRISAETLKRLLATAATQSGCEHFGLLMAEKRDLPSLGALGLLLAHQATARDVILAIVRHQHLFGDTFHISCAEMPAGFVVRFDFFDHEPSRYGVELLVSFFCRCISSLMPSSWAPDEIWFVHPAPADTRHHQRILGCPVRFGSEFTGLICSAMTIASENPAGNPRLAALAEPIVEAVSPQRAQPSTTNLVERSITRMIGEEPIEIEAVARQLGITSRTLQRRLAKEGARFADVLDRLRCRIAQEHLKSNKPITLVASLVGYTDSATFTRWFTSRFGQPPAKWRRSISEEAS